MIEHLRGRDRKLEPLGWTGQHAEWITLVCLPATALEARRLAPTGPSPSALRYASPGGRCTASSERTRPAFRWQFRLNPRRLDSHGLVGFTHEFRSLMRTGIYEEQPRIATDRRFL